MSDAREVSPNEAARLFFQGVVAGHKNVARRKCLVLINKHLPPGSDYFRAERLVKLITDHFPGIPPSEVPKMKYPLLLQYLQEIDAKQDSRPNEWSKPDTRKKWARVFKVCCTTFDRWRKRGTIRVRKRGRLFQVHIDDLPTNA